MYYINFSILHIKYYKYNNISFSWVILLPTYPPNLQPHQVPIGTKSIDDLGIGTTTSEILNMIKKMFVSQHVHALYIYHNCIYVIMTYICV